MLITIGGVSRAGKTTLAYLLRHLLGYDRCKVISQDDYPQSEHLIPKIKGMLDWELPESINWLAYEQYILAHLDQGKIVIAEGLFLHSSHRLPPATFHLQVEIDKGTFVNRRKQENRWGAEPSWYIEHVWSNHVQTGKAGPNAWRIDGSQSFPIGVLIQKILEM